MASTFKFPSFLKLVFLKVAEENYDDSDELKRNKLEEMADGGRLARNVTRLSFKRKKKLSLLGRMQGTNRVDSTTDLMADQDNALGVFERDSNNTSTVGIEMVTLKSVGGHHIRFSMAPYK
ncbi:hypothetical protein DPMN_131021 [Dreissena polymorpha]|uniref:Uncharacterized protein n=1 Tax=Dreissena polymorpha TaxID=45954 RepID=A0A9D4H7R8_DREPO|nr:hypothetical protein DPMN_131021 [Dreissena polymorpha]